MSLSSSAIQLCSTFSQSMDLHFPCPSVSHCLLQVHHGHPGVILFSVQPEGNEKILGREKKDVVMKPTDPYKYA